MLVGPGVGVKVAVKAVFVCWAGGSESHDVRAIEAIIIRSKTGKKRKRELIKILHFFFEILYN
jgi:hypothetical protein